MSRHGRLWRIVELDVLVNRFPTRRRVAHQCAGAGEDPRLPEGSGDRPPDVSIGRSFRLPQRTTLRRPVVRSESGSPVGLPWRWQRRLQRPEDPAGIDRVRYLVANAAGKRWLRLRSWPPMRRISLAGARSVASRRGRTSSRCTLRPGQIRRRADQNRPNHSPLDHGRHRHVPMTPFARSRGRSAV